MAEPGSTPQASTGGQKEPETPELEKMTFRQWFLGLLMLLLCLSVMFIEVMLVPALPTIIQR